MSSDKFYKIEQAIELIRNNKELIFEIRNPKEKDVWYEHMLLICVQGITGNYGLQYFTKPKEGITPYKWKVENYIPFNEKIEWYISPLTKVKVQNSINDIGIRSN
ncbi:hypothetical protein N493_15135 [Clostridium botulinum B2 433]|uniref:hypothetical protein n=1 Tax=Clostridium botulinum TaxID=1491 RepID=UPI0007DFE2B1|nr:hypothetical protein [Clostridium botulinum]KEI90739.1 hypothetical protein N493_15135 [Clostridium botulinum B2 433]